MLVFYLREAAGLSVRKWEFILFIAKLAVIFEFLCATSDVLCVSVVDNR